MTASERTAFESGRTADITALEASLTVAWMESNVPAAGEEGSSCETTACSGANQCCGTSTPTTGAYVNPTLADICVD